MRCVGHIATYPGRINNLPAALDSVVGQLDEVHVVLNQFTKRQQRSLPKFDNVTYTIPSEDLKDTGKFLRACTPGDYVFLMDDDLIFPIDYVSTLIRHYRSAGHPKLVVGLHGVVYSDLFEGAPTSRFVAKFDKALARPMLVNQLGTGCLMVPGELMPPFEYMRSSQRFVDVRFARYCYENDVGMLCVPRPTNWVQDQQPTESIFETYTRERQREQLPEILQFAGFGKLNPKLAVKVERA